MIATHTTNGHLEAETAGAPDRSSPTAAKKRISRAESNRLNAQKSTGPRTAAGKANSRYNALKHGMTAQSTVLPGEDGAEFEARRGRLHADLEPRNSIEAILVDRIASAEWVAKRAENGAAAQLAYRVRHDSLDLEHALQHKVIELGQRLLHDPAESRLGYDTRAGCPGHPARLVLELENSVQGCDWLLKRYGLLKEHVDARRMWVDQDGYELVRLLGHYVSDLASDYEIAALLLARECVAFDSTYRKNSDMMFWAIMNVADLHRPSQMTAAHTSPTCPEPSRGKRTRGNDESPREPQRNHPTVLSLAELVRLCAPSLEPLRTLPLEKFVPSSVAEARRRLAVVIDEQVQRVERLRARLVQIAEADDADAATRLAFEPGPEAEKQRRYGLARDRLFIQTINTFLKIRKAALDGTLDPIDPDSDDGFAPDAALNPFDPIVPGENAAAARSPEPSRALRLVLSGVDGAGTMPPAPAGDDLPWVPLVDASVHTSPACPEPGRGKRERGICEMPETVQETAAQSTCQQTVCGESHDLRNEPIAPCRDAQPEQPPIGAGTGPSTELGAGPSTELGTGPSTQLTAGPSAQLRQGPCHQASRQIRRRHPKE